MSPEIVYQQSHGFAVDIWCLGILLYEMLHGSPPFKAENLNQIKQEFRNKRLTIDPSVDRDVVDLIKKLLNFEASSRISIDEVLAHKAFAKNMRHIKRPITQEEYKLLVKYYYLNSGGTNLETHNKEYVKHLKRESALTKTPSPSQAPNDQISGPSSPFEKAGKREFDVLLDNELTGKNNFEPAKFKSPETENKKKIEKSNVNDFQPKTFVYSNLQTSNTKEEKKKKENDDIRFYQPPKLIGEGNRENQRKSGFKKKKKPEIGEEKRQNSTKRKFSSLKKKLQIKEKKTLAKKEDKTIKLREESKKKTLKQLKKQTGNRINLTKRKIKLLNKPIQTRSFSLNKGLNSSLLSLHSSASNQKVNLSNYLSNPVNSLSTSKLGTQGNPKGGPFVGTSGSSRPNRFLSKVQNTKQIKRDTSQSIERALNLRTIKESSSLPKGGFLKANTQRNENKNFLLKQIQKNIQKKKGVADMFKSFKKGPKPNLKNFSSINYKVDEVIPEELYLSQFQTIPKKVDAPQVAKKDTSTTLKKSSQTSPFTKPVSFVNSKILKSQVSTSSKKLNVSLVSGKEIVSQKKFLGEHKKVFSKGDSQKNVSLEIHTSSQTLKFKNQESKKENLTEASKTQLSSFSKSNSIFQDYNFESTSKLNEKLPSQKFSSKEMPSIQAISEKRNSPKKEDKIRNAVFGEVSTGNTQVTLRKDDKKPSGNLTEIDEETHTLKTQTTFKEGKEKSFGKTKKKETEKKEEGEQRKVIPKYVKRIVYVNGVKKIQMILSKPFSPQQEMVAKNEKHNFSIVKSSRTISYSKSSQNNTPLRKKFEEIQKRNSDNVKQKEEEPVQLEKELKKKKTIKWVNFESPSKESVSVQKGVKASGKEKGENHKTVAKAQSSLNNMKNLLHRVQTIQKEKQITKDHNGAITRIDLNEKKANKNYSYGIGDNLQKLISSSRQSYNPVRFQNSFIIQPDLEREKSPVKRQYGDSDSDSQKGPNNSSFSRYSMSKPVNYASNEVDSSRGSVPLQNVTNAQPVVSEFKEQKDSFNKSENFPSTTNNWKNYNFQKNEEKSVRGREPTSLTEKVTPTLKTSSSPYVKRFSSNVQKFLPSENKHPLSINIKQLPGLKESHSTGMLKMPAGISHSKNRSIDISNTKFRQNSQLRKIIDVKGNVRYKFINKPKLVEVKHSESSTKYSSAYRGSFNPYLVRNPSFQVKNN